MASSSYWSTFNNYPPPPSEDIDAILARDDFTLEELLDHEDVIHELKFQNTTLLEFLSEPNIMKQLINYIIIVPKVDDNEDGSEYKAEEPSKYHWLASELFACEEMRFLDNLFSYPQLLLHLFSFLDQPSPLDPSTAGYFRKVVVVLIQRKYEELLTFVRAHDIVDKLVRHIGLYSVLELLIMIGWDDGLDVQWLQQENLILKLVNRLDPTFEKEPDCQVNAARALVDIIVKCPPTQSSPLIDDLQKPAVLKKLFKAMFSGCLSSLTNILPIIIMLVSREARRAEMPEADGTVPEVITLVMEHLKQITDILVESPDTTKHIKTQCGVLTPPFGETRLKVVELFLVLVRSNHEPLNEEIARLNVIPIVLNLFFQYEWNNMLHGLVESIVNNITNHHSPVLLDALFIEGRYLQRLIQSFDLNDQSMAKRGGRGHRLGYMGHVIRTSNSFVLAVHQSSEASVAPYFKNDPQLEADWAAFVNGPLAQANEEQQTVVGGHRPSSPVEESFQQSYDQSYHSEMSFPGDHDDWNDDDEVAFDESPTAHFDEDDDSSDDDEVPELTS